MEFTSGEKVEFVLYFCSRMVKDYAALNDKQKEELFRKYSPMLIPLLSYLPENATIADIESGAVNLRHCAHNTLYIMAMEAPIAIFTPEEIIFDSIEEASVDNMVKILKQIIPLVLPLLESFSIYRDLTNFEELNLDEELRLMVESDGSQE